MQFVARLSVAFMALFLGSTAIAGPVTNVQDPSGKTVLVVEGDEIKTEAGGKAVLTITDDKITDAAGKLKLYCNGDFIRNEPNGKVLLYIDGRNILQDVGGAKVLYVDGKDLMRGDRSGKPLYKFTGDELTKQRRMAVLYVLMPEIFGATKEAGAKIIADQAKAGVASDAEAVKNFAPGTYNIDNYHSTDTTSFAGTVTIAKAGDVLVMDFKFTRGEPLQGIAIQRGDEIWAAVGAVSKTGLAVYKVDAGKLTGTWYNATGKPESYGTENLTGAEALGGEYKITEAKAPFTQAPYTGTLTLSAADKKFDGTVPIFLTAWDLSGYKVKGVGFAGQNSLAIATCTADDFSIIRFKINIKDSYLNGQFYTAGKVAGLWSLKKK